MPVTNKAQIERMTTLCGAHLPEKYRRIMHKFEDKKEALFDAGMAYAINQIVDLLTNDVDGIHLYTMNNPAVAQGYRRPGGLWGAGIGRLYQNPADSTVPRPEV